MVHQQRLSRESEEMRALHLSMLPRRGRTATNPRAHFVVSRGAAVGSLLSLMLALTRFALAPHGSVWPVLLTTSVALALTAMLGYAQPHVLLPYVVLPLIGWIGTTSMAAAEGGIYSESLFWMVLVPLVAVLSLGRRAAFPFALLVSVTTGLLCILNIRGILIDPNARSATQVVLRAFGFMGASVFAATLGWFYEGESSRAENRLLSVVMNMRAGIAITDARGSLLVTNRAFRTLFGIADPPELLVGQSCLDVLCKSARPPREPQSFRNLMSSWTQKGIVEAADEFETLDGRILEVDFVPIDNPPTSYLWCYQDVSQRATREREILSKLHSDRIAGVSSRLRLEDELAIACLARVPFAVLFIDLDGFKNVNDHYGHSAGDEVLAQVGLRLKSSLRDADMVGRLGGDEFAILLRNVSNPAVASIVATKLIASLAIPIEVAGADVKVGASIGIALFPEHGADGQELLRVADQAMYAVKKRGKNSWGLPSDESRMAILPNVS
jgi:diguanylate cyclase (GGDEF)-like protein